MEPLRIAVYSNSPSSPSGYGVSTLNIVERIVRAGHEAAVLCNFGHHGMPLFLNLPESLEHGYWIFPYDGNGLGEAGAVAMAKKWEADLVVTNYDTWPMKSMFPALRAAQIPSMAWTPWDFLPDYGSRPMWENLVNATTVLPYSKYARKNFLDHLPTERVLENCYLGIDTDVFRPVIGDEMEDGTKVTKEMFKEKRGFDEGGDVHITMINKMNKAERVAYPYMLEGWKLFAENNLDIKPRLYLNCDLNQGNGYPLDSLLSDMGIGELVKFTTRLDQGLGLTPEQLSALYNSADVTLCSTLSEGMGLPIIESLGCGVPVVSTNAMVMKEVLEPVCKELLVMPQAEFWQNVPGKYVVPDVPRIADALEKSLKRDPEKDRETLSQYARGLFDYDTVVFPRFMEAVNQTLGIADQICWKVPEPSEELKAKAKPVEVYSDG